jgi:hypothetical protein
MASSPEVGAGCGKAARPDLWRGLWVNHDSYSDSLPRGHAGLMATRLGPPPAAAHPGNLGTVVARPGVGREGNPSVGLDETGLQGYCRSFGPVSSAELGIDVGDVAIDGRDGDDQFSRDFLRRAPASKLL